VFADFVKGFKSSNVKAASYNKRLQRMTIRFKGSRTYRYYGVKKKTYDALLKAKSKGRHVNNRIAYNFDYERVK
jgi:hypothetical protein